MYEVALLPILLAAVANVILGAIWYHPKVFGGVWMRAVSVNPDAGGSSKMWISMILQFISALVMAYVMAHFGIAWGVFDWIGAIELAFWLWIGFSAVPMFGMYLWESRPFKAFAIVAGYWLIAMIVMSVILTLWI